MGMRIRLALWTALAAILAIGSDVWAQAGGDGFTPPEIDEVGQWKNWSLMALFVIAVCLAAFKKSKRTHLD